MAQVHPKHRHVQTHRVVNGRVVILRQSLICQFSIQVTDATGPEPDRDVHQVTLAGHLQYPPYV